MDIHAGLVPKTPPHLLAGLIHKSRVAPKKLGKKEEETGREILHKPNDAGTIQDKATEEHPWVRDDLQELLKDIPGAKLHGARDEKDADRLKEKMADEGQTARTIPDYSGFRVAVDTREAHKGTAAAIRGNFKIVREKDEFEKGAPDTAFHSHMMQVRRPGSDVSHEVQVLPRQVADTAEETHALYEKARTGDKGAAAKMKAHNEAAWQEFEAAQKSVKSDDVGTKYKFGSTQANLHPSSAAAKSIKAAQDVIPAEHLAGDGKDVDDPHVTVRYGIQSESKKDALRKFIRGQRPFTAKLGPTAAFPPSEHSDGAAPIHAPVHSPELHRMNAEIEKHGDFAASSFPEYRPHVTVAYVKPEVAKKYVGNHTTDGKEFHVSSIAISDRDGNKEDVPMLGESNSEKQGGRGESPERTGDGADNALSPAKSSNANSEATPRKEVAQIKTGVTVRLADGRTGVVKGISPKGNMEIRLEGGGRVKAERSAVQVVEPPAKGITVGTPGHDRPSVGSIACDLDKTLCEYDGFKGATVIGDPIAAQVADVKKMLANGADVWIYTARVAHPEAIPPIQKWCKQNIGQVLPITNIKYPEFAKFIDDRAELPVQMRKGGDHASN
jgi:2'-5' RNA ligase